MSSTGLSECTDADRECPATQLDVGSSSASEDDGNSASLVSDCQHERPGLADACEVVSSSEEPSPQRLQSSGNWLSLLAAVTHSANAADGKKASLRKRAVGPTVHHEAFMPLKTHSASSSSRVSKGSCTDVASRGVLLLPVLHEVSSATADDPPKKRLNRGNVAQRPSIPSYTFLSSVSNKNESGATTDSMQHGDVTGSVLEQVEAFVTIAGRSGIGGSITKRISVRDVERAMPVSFIPELLPPEFADHLCRSFQSEAGRWHTSKRWLYDKEIESHRLESGFRFDRNGLVGNRRYESAGFGDDLRHLRQVVAGAVQRTRAELRKSWRAERKTNAAAGMACAEKPEKLSAHEVAQEIVALASRGQRLGPQTVEWLMRYAHEYKETGWRWEPNYCVANYYVDENDFLGAHSDPVESIGPWAIIASLTFGAARHFRMKPVGTVRTGGETSGRVTSYSIRLPHNSLLIMWEGFQEFWRHEVPKDNGLRRHSIIGPARLNFTFRKSVFTVAKRRPMCQCRRKAHLKPVLKESSKHRGRYFWSCSNPRVKKGEYCHCDYFKWDDELVVGENSSVRPKSTLNSAVAESHLQASVALPGSHGMQLAPAIKDPSHIALPPSRAHGGA